jgi:hypothetical protein
MRTQTLLSHSLYGAGAKSFDEVSRNLMEEVPPESFLRWTKEELERPTQTSAEVRRRR